MICGDMREYRISGQEGVYECEFIDIDAFGHVKKPENLELETLHWEWAKENIICKNFAYLKKDQYMSLQKN